MQARQHQTRSAGRAGSILRLAENPYREPRPKKGSEVYGSNTTARCRRENHSVYPRTHDAKIELALTYTLWLSYYAAPLDAAYQLIVASAPRRATLGIYKTPVAAHRLGEHTQLTVLLSV